jgi:hypothetical protein
MRRLVANRFSGTTKRKTTIEFVRKGRVRYDAMMRRFISMLDYVRFVILISMTLLGHMLAYAQTEVLKVTDKHAVTNGPGESEIAVSGDGQHVVIAVNAPRGFQHAISTGRQIVSHSHHGGTDAFIASALPGALSGNRDPSVTWTGAGKFYFSTMGPASNAVLGVSVDNGTSFQQVKGTPALCTGKTCESDQPHIAGDRRPGQNQLYIVWHEHPTRNDRLFAMVGCSTDSGVTWTNKIFEEATWPIFRFGFFPRVAVGSDGFVYVVAITGNTGGDILLQRYSPCSQGLNPLWHDGSGKSTPSKIASISGVHCDSGNTVAGLDRCNDGNVLASPTIALDSTHPKRISVVYSDEISPHIDTITVASTGDITALQRDVQFPDVEHLESPGQASAGQRFMPWGCMAHGRFYAGFYDRRSQTPEHNDRTEYFVADSQGHEVSVSGTADPQCDSGWPDGGNPRDSEACSQQPQQAGFCLACPAGSQVGDGCSISPSPEHDAPRCDYSSPDCPSGTACIRPVANRGNGKYGDYTGIACANDVAFVTWTSSVSPTDMATFNGLRVYFAKVTPKELQPPHRSPACQACEDEHRGCADGTRQGAQECRAEYNACKRRSQC